MGWPTSVKIFLQLQDGVDYVIAQHPNERGDEITAIETWLLAYPAYIKVSDVKAQNTDGGTFTSGAWQTRDINTEDMDTGNHCSIASNQITLAPGTYECCIKCPAYEVDGHQARLQNITDAVTTLIGTSGTSSPVGASVTFSTIMGRFTITTQKTFEIQHQCNTTKSNRGFGFPNNWTSEVYTIAEFKKVY